MATAQHTMQSYEVMGGQSLKAALAKAERRNKIRAFMLVAPLLLFITFTFLAPIVRMMYFSFDNPVVVETFPKTIEALDSWNPTGAPTPEGHLQTWGVDPDAVRVGLPGIRRGDLPRQQGAHHRQGGYALEL